MIFSDDFNECDLSPSVCPVDQKCVNEDGSYQCYCTDANHIAINGACVGMFIHLLSKCF